MCSDFLYNFVWKHFSIWEEFSDILLHMCLGLNVKYPLFLSYINADWIFSTYFRKHTQISNFMKIHPVGAQLSHANGRMDRQDEANRRSPQFCECA